MNTLTLTLKKKWFDLIKSGIKNEEYREIKPYWIKRLTINGDSENFSGNYEFRKFDNLMFTLGYPKSDDFSRRMNKNFPSICIGYGKPEWGAIPGKIYFVIRWNVE